MFKKVVQSCKRFPRETILDHTTHCSAIIPKSTCLTIGHVDTHEFNQVVKHARDFCYSQNWKEVCTQTRPSILAACEDPKTLIKYKIGGVEYAGPQTGQMWLEHELLQDATLNGVFCLTASYRDEPNPIPGRHHLVFPLFEMESRGDISIMIETWTNFLIHFGYKPQDGKFPIVDYQSICDKYGVSEIGAKEEMMLYKDYGPVVFLAYFPESTNPFWNMRKLPTGDYAKIDVILSGQETLGSAERSRNVNEMRQMFENLEQGEYKNLLYKYFGKERVDAEVDTFLNLNMSQRFGGGLGLTRLIHSLKTEKML